VQDVSGTPVILEEVQASFMRLEESCITAEGSHLEQFLQEVLYLTPIDTKVL
jgi:hypothetical protein